MKCDKTSEITAFLKGETPEAERETLRAHFEQCDACGRELERFDRVLKALGRMEQIEPAPDFKWRVRQAFLQAHPEFLAHPLPERLSWWDSLRESFGFVPAWALSISAHVLLFAVLAVLFFTPKGPDEEMDAAAVRAQPRRSPGGAPHFGAPAESGHAPSRAAGGRLPEPSSPEFDPGTRRVSEDAIIAPRRRANDPNLERLDLKAWHERLPRDRRILAYFKARTTGERARLPEKTAEAVRAGLEWLARAQQPDGRWTGPTVRAEREPFTFETGLTGLALLAFLADGHAGAGGPYGETVRKGLRHLLAEQRASGLIGSDIGHYMYDHAIAALAILEASLMTGDEDLRAAASAAVHFTLRAQNDSGGWGYEARASDNDTSVAGWQVLLLRMAKLGGNSGVVPALLQAHESIRRSTGAEGRVGYRGPGEFPNGHHALTAVGMLAHQMSRPTPDPEVMDRQAKILLERSPLPGVAMENDLYLAYFGSLAMRQHDGAAWDRWHAPLRETLLKAQREDGSWPAAYDRWAVYGKAIYTTAISVLILETPIRYPRLAD